MNPYFTIYTPTFNRSHLLPRVYDSLLVQDERSFEWLIVDDGSTDDTKERVSEWMAQAPFEVRYQRQQNQGKHIATNRAAELAQGEFFVVLDSDDWLVEGGLRAIRAAWEDIPEEDRHRFANVAGQFLGTDGQPVTRKFPADTFDCNSVEMETRHGISGEIAMATRTDIRQRYPFPENVGRYCMPSLVWNRIAVDFKTRYINTPLQYKEYQQQGITLSGLHRKISLSPESFRIRSRELIDFPFNLPLKYRSRCMRMFIRASLHAGIPLLDQWRETAHKLVWLSQVLKARRDFRKDQSLLTADR